MTTLLGSLGNQLSELPKPSLCAAFLFQPRRAGRDTAVIMHQHIDGSNPAITGSMRSTIKFHKNQLSGVTHAALGNHGKDCVAVLMADEPPFW